MPLSDAEIDALIAATPQAKPSASKRLTDQEIDALIQSGAAEPGKLEALGRGAAQGVTFGFGDELKGLYDAASSAPSQWIYEKLNPDAEKSRSFAERYTEGRDVNRANNESARKAHGGYYLTGEIAGAVAPALLTMGASSGATAGGLAARGSGVLARALAPKAVALAAGQGAAQGLGYSNADTAGRLASDSLIGAGLGLAGHAAGSALGAAGSRLIGRGASKAAKAEATAAATAEAEKLAEQASKQGKYGGLRQGENKAIKALLDLERDGIISPKNKEALDALRKSGRLADALNEAAANDLEFLAERTPQVSSAKAAMLEGKAALPEAIAAKKSELLSSAAARGQIMERVKRYGPPAVGSLIGSAVGGPVGTAVGFLAGAGSRPMVRALERMSKHPSVQAQIAKAMMGTGRAVNSAGRSLTGGGVALTPATAALLLGLKKDEE